MAKSSNKLRSERGPNRVSCATCRPHRHCVACRVLCHRLCIATSPWKRSLSHRRLDPRLCWRTSPDARILLFLIYVAAGDALDPGCRLS